LIVEFSKPIKEKFLELKSFLFINVYKNHQVNRINHKTQTVIKDLFNHFMSNPETLPKSWQDSVNINSDALLSEMVINYIAGMTDRFAVIEHKKIFDLYHY
jgi:dGTPase